MDRKNTEEEGEYQQHNGMELFRGFMKRPRQSDSLAIGLFAVCVFYAIFNGTASTILVGVVVTCVVAAVLPKQVSLAFFLGALAILLVQKRRNSMFEGFADAKEEDGEEQGQDEDEDTSDKEGRKEKEVEVNMETDEGFSAGKPMLPDNADRKEMLELGKSYKLPSEKDDEGYHLDSGTTFLNAYKALKPDQIAAMTRDTQELLATQKSLVAMLDSFGPLMKDMGKITGIFGPGSILGPAGGN